MESLGSETNFWYAVVEIEEHVFEMLRRIPEVLEPFESLATSNSGPILCPLASAILSIQRLDPWKLCRRAMGVVSTVGVSRAFDEILLID